MKLLLGNLLKLVEKIQVFSQSNKNISHFTQSRKEVYYNIS
jgi:hypothetical protein